MLPFVWRAVWWPVALFLLAGAASWVTVGGVRRYALRRGVLDHPNERSSHTVPTPRGGGLGAVLVLLGALGLLAASRALTGISAIAIGAAVAIVAWVGWCDDHDAVPARIRLAVHVVAGVAIASVAAAAGASGPIALPAVLVPLWWIVWTVSAINVTNFMDGIDGLIASQLLLYASFVSSAVPAGSAVQQGAAATAGAAVGFLVWNWSPARIFLGDVGSGAFGVIVVVLGIALMHENDASVVRSYLPLAPLFGDALVTLVRRSVRGDRIWIAHREHLYQRLANGPWSHARTTILYGSCAAVGALIALFAPTGMFGMATGSYAVFLVVVGVILERIVARSGSRGSELGEALRTR